MNEINRKKVNGWTILIIYTTLLVIISIIYVCSTKLVPEGLELRTWYEKGVASILLLIWFCTVVAWSVAIQINVVSKLSKYRSRIVSSIIVWSGCFVAMGFSAFLMLAVNLQGENEIKNENGTLTVKWSRWLHHVEYSLYEKEGILYRRYLRPMDNEKDTDPDITYEQYYALKRAEEESRKEDKHDAEPEVETHAYGQETEQPYMKQIEKGYLAVYDEFLSETSDMYQEDYDARGNSRIIIHEDTANIKYLVYDRDSQNGECGLYVYFECEKGEDGVWSPVDAKILGIYAFIYEDGTVIDSGKTFWSDLGTEEYRKATGE